MTDPAQTLLLGGILTAVTSIATIIIIGTGRKNDQEIFSAGYNLGCRYTDLLDWSESGASSAEGGASMSHEKGCQCTDCARKADRAAYMREYRQGIGKADHTHRQAAERKALRRLRKEHPEEYRRYYHEALRGQ